LSGSDKGKIERCVFFHMIDNHPKQSLDKFLVTFNVSQRTRLRGLPRDADTKKWDDRQSSEI
jgi:hypothetical protein